MVANGSWQNGAYAPEPDARMFNNRAPMNSHFAVGGSRRRHVMDPSYPVDFGMAAPNDGGKATAAAPMANSYRAVRFSSFLTKHSPRQSPSNDAPFGRFLPKMSAQNVAGPNPGYGILGPPPKGLKPIISNPVLNAPAASGPRMFNQRGGRQPPLGANRMRFRQPYGSGAPLVTRGGVVKKRPAESVANKLVKKAKSVLSVVNFPISSSQRIAQLRKKYKESVTRKRDDAKAWDGPSAYPDREREPDAARAPYYYDQGAGRGGKSGDYTSGGREDFGEAYRNAHQHKGGGPVEDRAYNDWSPSKAHAAANEGPDPVRLSREKQLEEQISRAYAEYYEAIQQDMESQRSGAKNGPLLQSPPESGLAHASTFIPTSTASHRVNASGYQAGRQLPAGSQNVGYPYRRYYRYGEKTFSNPQQPKQVSDEPSKSYPVQQRQSNRANIAQSNDRKTAPGSAKPKPFSVGYLFQQNLIPEFSSSNQQNQRSRGSRWGGGGGPYWPAGGRAPLGPRQSNAYSYQNYPHSNRGVMPAGGNSRVRNAMMYRPEYGYGEDAHQLPPYGRLPEDGQEDGQEELNDEEVLMFD